MDSIWALRSAYNEARKLKLAQDLYCFQAENGAWDALEGDFPENPQWEVLVDVLRGKVKVDILTLRKFSPMTIDLSISGV